MENTIINKSEEIISETIQKYNMSWNFESIDHVINTVGVSFDNLQEADANNTNLRLIIQCGIKSHDKNEAFRIMDEIRELGVSPKIAHYAFVEVMKKKHFFSDTSERADIVQVAIERLQETLSQRNLLNNALEKKGC